jgi:hypothetical protein
MRLSDVELSNIHLARAGKACGFAELINPPWPSNHKSSQVKMFASTVEAVIGAVSVDSGNAEMCNVIDRLGILSDPLDMSEEEPTLDYISRRHVEIEAWIRKEGLADTRHEHRNS